MWNQFYFNTYQVYSVISWIWHRQSRCLRASSSSLGCRETGRTPPWWVPRKPCSDGGGGECACAAPLLLCHAYWTLLFIRFSVGWFLAFSTFQQWNKNHILVFVIECIKLTRVCKIVVWVLINLAPTLHDTSDYFFTLQERNNSWLVIFAFIN